ncbi:unnamed protein product [Alopecurus aequalis]
MSPRRNLSGYRGVRARPNGTFYAEIRTGNTRIGLGTFETAHESARAWDAAAWRLGRPRGSMNFRDVWTWQQAQDLAPPPHVVTEEDNLRNRLIQRRLAIVEQDERAMALWAERFPEDVAAERAFYAQRRARLAAKRARHAAVMAEMEADPNGEDWPSDDPRWEDYWTTSDVTTSSSDGGGLSD